MILVTGSHLERALECSASTCLPKAKNSSPEASEGRAIHIYIEFVSEYGRDKALAVMRDSPTLRDYVDVCEVIDTDLLPTELAHEVAFAFDIATGKAREIGRGNKVNYAECNLAPLEIPCRLDVVGVSADAVFVGDYKSGHLAVTGAKTNIQVGFGALCASLAYGKDSAVVEIIRTGRGGAKPFRDRAELDAFDLDALASRLRDWIPRRGRVLDVINAGKAPTVYQGPWYHIPGAALSARRVECEGAIGVQVRSPICTVAQDLHTTSGLPELFGPMNTFTLPDELIH